jgi:hypothetical protein
MNETKSIFQRISDINSEVVYIPATGFNENTNKYYRKKEDFFNVLQKPMAREGLVLVKEVTAFEEAPAQVGSKSANRATLAARFYLKSEAGEIYTDVIVTKLDFYDSGFLACMSLATSRALEDFFPLPTDRPPAITKEVTEDLVKQIYEAERGDLMKIAKANLSLVNNIYFQKLMKARETILKLSAADQATIKKGSEISSPTAAKEVETPADLA